jgi:hypothetical protein
LPSPASVLQQRVIFLRQALRYDTAHIEIKPHITHYFTW